MLEKVKTDEYINGTLDITNIEIKDMFIEEGVYVGDVLKLQEQLQKVLDKLSEEYTESDLTLKNTTIDKYNIILKDNDIEKIEFVMSMSMSGMGMEISMTMPMVYSKVGSTKVTIPGNLNE